MPPNTRTPSLTQDFRALADIYVTLAWLAVQRMRFGTLWPWDVRTRPERASADTVVRLVPRKAEDEDRIEAA